MDESGLLMTPLVRRTWGLRGQTPPLPQQLGKREKVSVAAALWMPPGRERLHWFSQTLVNAYFDNECVAVFVQGLLAEVGERLVLVWDGGPMHQGGPIQDLLAEQADCLTLELFPPYAPELNPVEPAWSWLKYGRLCNFAPRNAEDLHRAVLHELHDLPHNEALLRSFFKTSELPIPRALIT